MHLRLDRINLNSRTLLYAFERAKNDTVPVGTNNPGFEYSANPAEPPITWNHPHVNKPSEINMVNLAVDMPPSIRDQGNKPMYVVTSFLILQCKSTADAEELTSPLGQSAIQEGLASFLGVRMEYVEIVQVKIELATGVVSKGTTTKIGRRLEYYDVGKHTITNHVPANIQFRAFLKLSHEAMRIKQELTKEAISENSAPELLNAIKHALLNKQLQDQVKLDGADILASSTKMQVIIPAEANTTPAPTVAAADNSWLWKYLLPAVFVLLMLGAAVAAYLFANQKKPVKKRAIAPVEQSEPEPTKFVPTPVYQAREPIVYTSFPTMQPGMQTVVPQTAMVTVPQTSPSMPMNSFAAPMYSPLRTR